MDEPLGLVYYQAVLAWLFFFLLLLFLIMLSSVLLFFTSHNKKLHPVKTSVPCCNNDSACKYSGHLPWTQGVLF